MCFDLTVWQSLYTIVIYLFRLCYMCELFDKNFIYIFKIGCVLT